MAVSYVQPVQTMLPPHNPQGNPLQRMLAEYAAALKKRAIESQADEDEPVKADSSIGEMFTGLPRKEASLGPVAAYAPPGDKVPDAPAAKSSEPVTSPEGLSAAAQHLSSIGETSKTGKAALFNISADTKGSKSYGKFGLNNKSGSLKQFVDENPELGLPDPRDPGFDAAWNRTAAVNGDGMEAAHDKWHSKHIMGGLSSQLTAAGVAPEIANDPKVQLYMADRKVQMNNVGLNAALAHAKGAATPEEFVKAVDAVDRSRLGANFKSYLEDHPTHAKGLLNRHDLRLSAALSAADPDLTSKIVDFHRGGAGSGASPTRVAADMTGSSSPSMTDAGGKAAPDGLPHGVLEQQYAQQYNRALSLGYSPSEATEMANNWVKSKVGTKGLEQGLMPKYGEPGPFGVGIYSEPGKMPVPYQVPGALGNVAPVPGIPGAYEQTRPGPDGTLRPMIITPDVVDPSSAAPSVSPAPRPAPGPPVVTAPPAATPPPAPGHSGILGTTPPKPAPAGGGPVVSAPPVSPPVATAAPGLSGIGAKPGSKVALADTAGVVPAVDAVRSKVADAAKSGDYSVPVYDLERPKSSIENAANEALDWANKHPVQGPDMPNIIDEAMDKLKKAKTPGQKLDALKNITPLTEVHKNALEDQIKNQNKAFGELQKNYRDTREQGVKLAPELKAAREILDSPDFHAGPASKLVESVRGLKEEAESFFRTMATDARARNEEDAKAGRVPGSNPGVWERAADWVKNDHSATANQVYTKILSGSILQSLRGMLGPNAGQFRVQELKMLEQAFGNPNITLPANKVVMAMVDKLNDRHILLGQMADTYLRKHKVLDPAFEEAVTRFEERNPVFTSKELLELGNIAITGRGSKEPEPPPPPAVAPAPVGGPRGVPDMDEIRRERERRRGGVPASR